LNISIFNFAKYLADM